MSDFSRDGVVRLERLVPRALVDRASREVAAGLARVDTKKIRALPVFQQVGVLGQKVGGGTWLSELFTRELVACVSELGGAGLRASPPQLLLSLPQKTEWSLDSLNWHLDFAVPRADVAPGVQAFVLIADAAPRGGATLAIAGSHRLHYLPGGREGGAHAFLRRGEIAMEVGRVQNVGGVDVSVVEMSGRAGDVFVMDLRVLHSPSVNSSKATRMMATSRFLGPGQAT